MNVNPVGQQTLQAVDIDTNAIVACVHKLAEFDLKDKVRVGTDLNSCIRGGVQFSSDKTDSVEGLPCNVAAT